MLRRARIVLCDKAVSARATISEAPYLIDVAAPKPFIDRGLLRSFVAAFAVGALSVASLYWLMSHKVTTEAMHRRRFIYTLAREEAQAAARRRRAGYDDPYGQFVSPSCSRYKELVDQLEEQRLVAAQIEEQEQLRVASSTASGKLLAELRAKRPSTVLSDAYHSSLLHETAVDSAKCFWNGCVDNVQDAIRAAMESYLEMREESTVAAVQELARAHLGENAVATRITYTAPPQDSAGTKTRAL